MTKRAAWQALALVVLSAAAFAQGPATGKPEQVSVSVKIIEFQATRGVETGLSAYFQRQATVDWWGVVHPPRTGVMTADVTFPASTAAGITVFLDRLNLSEGEVELVLQALVDENRASILSQPRVMVMVGGENTIETTQRIPYENTTVVGATTVQTTDFRNTGVTLHIQVPDVVDVDGDWNTPEDTFIQLGVRSEVSEEGQRIVIALDDQLAGGGDFNLARNAISAPEFISRSIRTECLVKSGQVLVLGGLYSNTETKTIDTLPWISQAEEAAVSLAERIVPGDFLALPFSSVLGNRTANESRRELVFFIKAEIWRPAFTLPDEPGFAEEETVDAVRRKTPGDVIQDVITGITDIPQGIGEEIKRRTTDDGVGARLGGDE